MAPLGGAPGGSGGAAARGEREERGGCGDGAERGGSEWARRARSGDGFHGGGAIGAPLQLHRPGAEDVARELARGDFRSARGCGPGRTLRRAAPYTRGPVERNGAHASSRGNERADARGPRGVRDGRRRRAWCRPARARSARPRRRLHLDCEVSRVTPRIANSSQWGSMEAVEKKWARKSYGLLSRPSVRGEGAKDPPESGQTPTHVELTRRPHSRSRLASQLRSDSSCVRAWRPSFSPSGTEPQRRARRVSRTAADEGLPKLIS